VKCYTRYKTTVSEIVALLYSYFPKLNFVVELSSIQGIDTLETTVQVLNQVFLPYVTRKFRSAATSSCAEPGHSPPPGSHIVPVVHISLNSDPETSEMYSLCYNQKVYSCFHKRLQLVRALIHIFTLCSPWSHLNTMPPVSRSPK
jgi:hypothetical protein